eukprot:scaffold2989_cov184-Amphora_coffeaeformis.AAC.1
MLRPSLQSCRGRRAIIAFITSFNVYFANKEIKMRGPDSLHCDLGSILDIRPTRRFVDGRCVCAANTNLCSVSGKRKGSGGICPDFVRYTVHHQRSSVDTAAKAF